MERVVIVVIAAVLLSACSTTPERTGFAGYYPNGGRYQQQPPYQAPYAQTQEDQSMEVIMQRLQQLEVRVAQLESVTTGNEHELRRMHAAISDVAAVAQTLAAGRSVQPNLPRTEYPPAPQPARYVAPTPTVKQEIAPRVAPPNIEAPRPQPEQVMPIARTSEREPPPSFRDTSRLQNLTRPSKADDDVSLKRVSAEIEDDRLWQVVLGFDSGDELQKVNRFMKAHGIEDRYPLSTGGRHILYLGTYSRYSNAVQRREEISERTGLLPKLKAFEPGQDT